MISMIHVDQNDGWNIDTNLNLISHSCGFEAEYKGSEIYGIKQFPVEATITDIRKMVTKAEEILSSSQHKSRPVNATYPN
jgi:hypothetical protein